MMAKCQQQQPQRNRLCVKFEMDYCYEDNNNNSEHTTNCSNHLIPNGNHYLEINSENNYNSDYIEKQHHKLCLNDSQGINRRFSSELSKPNLGQPRIAISRANSDILLNTIGTEELDQINGGTNNKNNKREKVVKFETKRTNAALKKLANYINVKPRLKFKEHDYQRINRVLNIKSNKCRICSETIFFNCYECTQCKLNGHKKCLQNLCVKCPNKIMPPRLAVFGLEISSDNNQISEVLSTCIMEIEKRPIHKLRGIYKIEGNRSIIENLCLSFEFGSHLIDLSQNSPHDIAGVVKEYLNQISTPFFNQSLQKELIAIGREWPVRKVPYTQSGIAILVFELRRLVTCLTPAYRNNLAYLIYHLKRIIDRQNITEMTANALAVVFAPLIFRNETRNDSKLLLKNGEIIFHRNIKKNINNENANNDNSSRNENNIIKNENKFEGGGGVTGGANMGVQILLDVTLKIRVIELMIFHANDIFSNLD